jgi:hypothetical protein
MIEDVPEFPDVPGSVMIADVMTEAIPYFG